MREYFNVGERVISAGDADIEREDGSWDVPDIGVGRDYHGSATFVVYDMEDIDREFLMRVSARKYNEPLVITMTERFIVREMAVSDLPECYRMYDELKDCPYIEPLYDYEEEKIFTEKYIENMYGFFGYGLWLVFTREEEDKCGELVARIGIENRSIDGKNCQELGYLVKKSWQKKHVASEVCSAVIRLAKEELGLEELYICTDKKNIPSICLAEKMGFILYAADVDGMNLYRKIL